MSESEVDMPSLDEDLWLRFDLWSARAWETAMRGTQIAIDSGPSIITDDGPDGRVMALFHAAELAKEFAFAVNPNSAPPKPGPNDNVEVQILTPEMIVDMLSDDDD